MNIVTIHWMEYVVEFVAPRGRKKSILSNYVVSSTSGGRLASSEGNWMAKEKYSCAPIINSAHVWVTGVKTTYQWGQWVGNTGCSGIIFYHGSLHDVCKQRARACLFSLCKCTLASTDRKHMLRFESRQTLPPKTFQDFSPSCFLHRQSARSRLTKFYFLSKTYPFIRNSRIKTVLLFLNY